jgi:DNA-binding NarL/FixJ family response regulator
MQRRQSFAAILIGKSVLIREGIARILRASNLRTLASASCVEDLPPAKFQQSPLLFLIVHTGDEFNAVLEQIELLRDKHPKGRIAIVAEQYQQDELVSAYRAGAKGYFVNVMSCDVFVKSLELVMLGETIFPHAFLSFSLDHESNQVGKVEPGDDKNMRAILIRPENAIRPQLSPRERLILHYLIEGYSNKCVARKIDIAEATVKVHVKAILRKIGVQNRTQAAIWAINNGSLATPTNADVDPSTANAGGGFRPPLEVVSEIKQIGVSDPPPDVIIPEPDHVEVPTIGRFIYKSINRNGTRRLAK